MAESIVQSIYRKSLEKHDTHLLSEWYKTTQGDFTARICHTCHMVLIYIEEWENPQPKGGE